MPFLNEIVATPLDRTQETRGVWRLDEPLHYDTGERLITIPGGFETDLASVPWYIQWLVPNAGLMARPAVLHDYLLTHRDGSFKLNEIHNLFGRALREEGVPAWRVWLAVRAVKLASATKGEQ